VIDEVVAPLLHNNVVPAIVLADNIELPQLLATVTTGTNGIGLSADDAVAVEVQPVVSSVRVTLYVAEFVTVIDEVVAPLLHNNVVPCMALVDNIELPQLLTTVIIGNGVVCGSA
jgi:formate-dependent nitrite reductase membrane component NrfD